MNYLRAWRQYFGLTLETLAERINENTGSNTGKGTLSRWEGSRRGFDDGILTAIAEVYGRGMTAERLKHPPPPKGSPLPWETAPAPPPSDLKALAAEVARLSQLISKRRRG